MSRPMAILVTIEGGHLYATASTIGQLPHVLDVQHKGLAEDVAFNDAIARYDNAHPSGPAARPRPSYAGQPSPEGPDLEKNEGGARRGGVGASAEGDYSAGREWCREARHRALVDERRYGLGYAFNRLLTALDTGILQPYESESERTARSIRAIRDNDI